MEAELYRTFLRQAQRGEHLRRLTAMDEWKAVDELVQLFIDEADTVRGIDTDKEWLKRQARVSALEELRSTIDSYVKETQYALDQLNEETQVEP